MNKPEIFGTYTSHGTFFYTYYSGKVISHCHHYLPLCTLPNVSSQINSVFVCVQLNKLYNTREYISTYGLSR